MANWRVVTCSEMESEAQRHESTMTSTEQKVGVLLAIQSIIEAYIVVANYDSLLLVNNQIIINNAIRIYSFFQIVTYCVKVTISYVTYMELFAGKLKRKLIWT